MTAPIIDSNALPSTPAHEWASETLSSVPATTSEIHIPPPITQTQSYASTTASTPGFEFPGSYPRTPKDHPLAANATHTDGGIGSGFNAGDSLGGLAGQAKGAVSGITGAAGVGAGSVAGGIQDSLFKTAVTAAQYLPPQVVEYFPGGAAIVAASKAEGELGNLEKMKLTDAQGMSLPSEEHHLSLSSKGVGSLPGPASEASVAKLPLERQIDDDSKDAQGMSLPSEEHHLSLSSKGVGSLPGPASEASVAKLPLERQIDDESKEVDIKSLNLDSDNELESVTNMSTVAQAGSGNTTPAMTGARTPTTRGSMATAVITDHKLDNLDERVPPSSSPTYTSSSSSKSKAVEPVPINLAPRTHPLGAQGAVLGGVVLEERADAMEKENEDDTSTTASIASPTPTAISAPVSSIPPNSNSINSGISLDSDMGKSLPRVPQNDSTNADAGHSILSSPSTTSSGPAPASSSAFTSPSSASTRFAEGQSRHKKSASESAASTSSTQSESLSSESGSTTGTPNGTPQRRKTKLLTKLRGEAKILSGKLGGKEEKVEEGRRIVRGEV